MVKIRWNPYIFCSWFVKISYIFWPKWCFWFFILQKKMFNLSLDRYIFMEDDYASRSQYADSCSQRFQTSYVVANPLILFSFEDSPSHLQYLCLQLSVCSNCTFEKIYMCNNGYRAAKGNGYHFLTSFILTMLFS